VAKAGRDPGFVTLDAEAFGSAKAISIDYAVMEKTTHAAVIPADCGSSDVGSWRTVWELSEKDGQGNAARGNAVFENSRNCIVATNGAVVALEGIDDLVVVATEDAILVSRLNDASGLKRLVARLKSVVPKVTEEHIKVHRPWGNYQSVDNGECHQVKRIVVKPGTAVVPEKHFQRSEHWIVGRGAERVTVDDQVKMVRENESIYVPIGAAHDWRIPARSCWS
jgi:mannose-1-phosphate guanylyltransferase/mannose-6-phosphate isomerase